MDDREMNPNTMTAQECADWMASEVGLGPVSGQHCTERWDTTPDGESFLVPDPFPLTLDGAAQALPNGWKIWDMEYRGDGCVVAAILGKHEREIYTDGPDELTARYRLAVACRMAAKEQA